MDKKRKVLIADSDPYEVIQLKDSLEISYDVIAVSDNGKDALQDIISKKPDIVIIDLMLPGLDGIEVIHRCMKQMSKEEYPAFIALTMIENQNIMECIRQLNITYCMMKPVQADILVKRISQMVGSYTVDSEIQINQKEKVEEEKRVQTICAADDVRRKISLLVRNIGVPAHIKGCRYLKFAILMAMEDSNCVNYITKLLYPEIAKKCGTTTSSVERAIRHAIDIVWIRGNKELLTEIFGEFVMEENERPTNSTFIAAVSDWMRIDQKIKVS